MRKAGQVVRDRPEIPRADERLRCLRLVAEEAFFEFADALGLSVFGPDGTKLSLGQLKLEATHEPDLVEVADAIADGHYVLTCASAACGIDEEQIIDAVNASNLAKFGPGHTIREDGKLVKPPGFKPPDIEAILKFQSTPPDIYDEIWSSLDDGLHRFSEDSPGGELPLVLFWDYLRRDGFDYVAELFPWFTLEHQHALEKWTMKKHGTAMHEFGKYFGRLPKFS